MKTKKPGRPGWQGRRSAPATAEPEPTVAELPPAVLAQQSGEAPLAVVGAEMMARLARVYDGPGTWRMMHLVLADGSRVVGPMLFQDADADPFEVFPAMAAAAWRGVGKVNHGN